MVSNILKKIVEERRSDAIAAMKTVSLEELKDAAGERTHHSLIQRLQNHPEPRIIAEIKKASPSAGILRDQYNPGELVSAYADAGACALSVLTEPRHFAGSLKHLRLARQRVNIPILRKDFICTEYQVAEAAAWGADVVLLIVAALETGELEELFAATRRYGLEALVETHTEAEIKTALLFDDALIGVNSRNLKTLKTDLNIARNLAEMLPANRITVAESGISGPDEIMELEAVGYDGFLIGESFLNKDDPGRSLSAMITNCA